MDIEGAELSAGAQVDVSIGKAGVVFAKSGAGSFCSQAVIVEFDARPGRDSSSTRALDPASPDGMSSTATTCGSEQVAGIERFMTD